MFYVVELEREVEIHPKDLGPHLRERIEQKLADEVRRGPRITPPHPFNPL
jgi:DNA-directed RNA polymerase subunit E'/Rpb7